MTAKNPFLYASIALFGLSVLALIVLPALQARANDATMIPSTIATSTTDTVGTTALRVIATSTCAARIISTGGTSGVMLTFSDIQGAVPSGTVGLWQAASTTVAYPASQYGCGAVRAYAGVSTLLNVVDAR